MAAAGERFDVVLAMEVIEHVADRDGFVAACGSLLNPGGILFVATINRTLKAYALAIFGAEVVLRWLPRGTHDYAKLVRPVELEASLRAAMLTVIDRQGIVYNPLADSWTRSTDMDVNYMILAEKPATLP
jgi:2-polyprenyl-6-hydroxyphenyl methylase/3-demethylubiquinone-9 3-methyltransferase